MLSTAPASRFPSQKRPRQNGSRSSSSASSDEDAERGDRTDDWEVRGIVVSIAIDGGGGEVMYLVEWKESWGSERRPDRDAAGDDDEVVIFDSDNEDDGDDCYSAPTAPWRSDPPFMSWLKKTDLQGAPEVLAAHARHGQQIVVHSAGGGWDGIQAVCARDPRIDLTDRVQDMIKKASGGWTEVEGWDLVDAIAAAAPASASHCPAARAAAVAAEVAPPAGVTKERFMIHLEQLFSGRMKEVRESALRVVVAVVARLTRGIGGPVERNGSQDDAEHAVQ